MTIEPKISKHADAAVDRAVERKIGALDKSIRTYIDEFKTEGKVYIKNLSEENRKYVDKIKTESWLYVKKLNEESDRRMDKLTADNKRHMSALMEFFQDEVKIVAELIQERPTRDEMRDITHEEIEICLRPVNAKLDFLNEERHAMMDAIADIKA